VTRALAAYALLACAAPVLADGGAKAREVEEPPRVMTLAINPDDAVPAEVQARLAGQRPASEFVLHCTADGALDRVEEVKPIPGCEAYLQEVLSRQCHRISPSAPYRVRQTIELSFRTAPAPSGATAAPTKFKNVPPFVLDREMLQGAMPRLPDLVKIQHRNEELVGVYKLCVAPEGNVVQVSTVTPIPDANAVVVSALKQWKYTPQPIGRCTLMRFVFTIGVGRSR
jgi:hypothetical protein